MNMSNPLVSLYRVYLLVPRAWPSRCTRHRCCGTFPFFLA